MGSLRSAISAFIMGALLVAVAAPAHADVDPVARGLAAKALATITQVNVSNYGARGDGTTNDTLALRSAITAAGANATIVLPPGKTFVVCGSLDLLQGQTISGYAAKVKRCGAVTTTTTASISTGTGSTNVAVASSASYTVGMDVAVWQSTSVYDTSVHRITAIPDGTHITLATAFTTGLASGSNVTTAFPIFNSPSNSDVHVFGVEIDGNRSNNTGIAKWWWHAGMYLLGDRSIVRDTYVHDEVSEGIELGGLGSTAQSNYLLNLGGNGIHFSGSTGARVINNSVKNVNLAGTATDHADGCIIFSNNTGDSIVADNYCENGISGVASIDSDDNSSVVISGNIIKSCTSTAIEGMFPTTSDTGGKVTITGNLIYSSVTVNLTGSGTFTAGKGPYNWLVSNNYFYQTTLNISDAFRVSVLGNQFDLSGDTTSSVIYPSNSQNVVVENNQVRGGQTGLFVDGSSTSGLKIKGNLFQNNAFRGVYLSQHSGQAVSVEGNTVVVESGFTATSGWIGIYAPAAGSFVTGNTFDARGTFSGSSYGIRGGAGGVSTTAAIVTNNFVRSAGLTAAIFFPGSSQGNVAAYNFTQQAVTDSGTNTLTGNVTIN